MGEEEKKGRSRLTALVSVASIVGLALAAWKYLDSDAMLRAWHAFTWDIWGYLLALPAFYLLFKSARFADLISHLTKHTRATVMHGYAGSQSASLLPGGVAMRAAMMHKIGIPVERSTGPILANSASDQLLLLGTGLVLCYHYPNFRNTALILTTVLVVLVAAVSFDRTRSLMTLGLQRMGAKFGAEEKVDLFLKTLPTLLSVGLWLRVMTWTLLANAVSVIILCLVVHALGFPVEPWPLTAAFVVPGLLGRLSPLPAGAGVTEAGMVGFMAAQTSMNVSEAAVATIIFRIVDIILPALYGAICQLFFLRRVLKVSEAPV